MNVGVGEAALGGDYLAAQSEAASLPIIASNVDWAARSPLAAYVTLRVADWNAARPTCPPAPRTRGAVARVRGTEGADICILGAMAEDAATQARQYQPSLTWRDPIEAADEVLSALPHRPDLVLLLFSGSLDQARQLAHRSAAFDMILVTATDGQMPSALAELIGDTRLVTVGAKGQWLTSVTLRRDATQVRHEWVSDQLRPDDTVRALMDVYHAMVNHYAARTSPVAAPQERGPYMGSKACLPCHEAEYTAFATTDHARAYKTLAQRQRQGDPECLPCHVTGFQEPGGFPTGEATARLAEVGCEACHGAGRQHADSPHDGYARGMPCVTCHTTTSSPSFDRERYWQSIRH